MMVNVRSARARRTDSDEGKERGHQSGGSVISKAER